jgi:DNA-binding transcriptional LysR family regulator
VSFLVHAALNPEREEGKLLIVPMKDEKIFLDVYLAYLKDQKLSPAVRAFFESIVRMANGETPLPPLVPSWRKNFPI